MITETREAATLDRHTVLMEMYLDLMKRCLTRTNLGDYSGAGGSTRSVGGLLLLAGQKLLALRGLEVVRPVNRATRTRGGDWPLNAETMIGLTGLDNLEYCIADVLRQEVPGDLIETGVWRGGATIFMRTMLKAYGDTKRKVWVADSFRGLPRPNPDQYPADEGDRLSTFPLLAVSLDEVKKNFSRYGMLDQQVVFLAGWFRDTLPRAPIEKLAVLRIDGDMYESTMDPLRYLYPKLSIGGYVIIDDYCLSGCKKATDDFRRDRGITDELNRVDSCRVFWRRTE